MISDRLCRSRRPPPTTSLLTAAVAPLLLLLLGAACASGTAIDPASTLECHRREYTYKVVRADSLGRKCWDFVTVMSCWGRCDSNEIADWKFPYKMSSHPVCMHSQAKLRSVELRNCEPDAEPGTALYEYFEASSCACQVCRTAQANCEGLHHHASANANDNDNA